MGKKPGPKKRVRVADRARTRAFATSDTEWDWITAKAKREGVSASSLVRQLIRDAMAREAPTKGR